MEKVTFEVDLEEWPRWGKVILGRRNNTNTDREATKANNV